MPLPEQFRNPPGEPRTEPATPPEANSPERTVAGASASAGACARTREEEEEQPAAGEVVQFPGAVGETAPGPGGEIAHRDDPGRGRAALEVWTREARETAVAAVDGSVWRARPASLRDREARIRRAEWSGGLPVLALPGRAYGYLMTLPVTLLCRATEQVASRPMRLLALALAVLIPYYLA